MVCVVWWCVCCGVCSVCGCLMECCVWCCGSVVVWWCGGVCGGKMWCVVLDLFVFSFEQF